jgi:hypothetical protein
LKKANSVSVMLFANPQPGKQIVTRMNGISILLGTRGILDLDELLIFLL